MRGGGGADDGGCDSSGTRNGTTKYIQSSTCYKSTTNNNTVCTLRAYNIIHVIGRRFNRSNFILQLYDTSVVVNAIKKSENKLFRKNIIYYLI